MHTIGAVFRTRAQALSALRELAELDLPQSKVGILTPGRDRESLGEAAVAGVIPGIGPAVGAGEMGTLLALTTRGASERIEGPARAHRAEDVDTYHEAVRRGHSVVLILVMEERHAGSARDRLFRVGEALEGARRRWEDEAQAFALAAAILRPSSHSLY